MPASKGDTIDRLNLELHFSSSSVSQDDALHTAEQVFEDSVLTEIEKVLEKYTDTNLTIDNLALNLGRVRKEDVPQRLRELLIEELDKFKTSETLKSADSKISNSLSSKDDTDSSNNMRKTYNDTVESGVSQEDLASLLCDYLTDEIVPWYTEIDDFELGTWLSQGLRSILESPQYATRILQILRTDISALSRVLMESDEETLTSIIKILLPDGLYEALLEHLLPMIPRSAKSFLLKYLLRLDEESVIGSKSGSLDFPSSTILGTLQQILSQYGPVPALVSLIRLPRFQMMKLAELISSSSPSPSNLDFQTGQQNEVNLAMFIILSLYDKSSLQDSNALSTSKDSFVFDGVDKQKQTPSSFLNKQSFLLTDAIPVTGSLNISSAIVNDSLIDVFRAYEDEFIGRVSSWARDVTMSEEELSQILDVERRKPLLAEDLHFYSNTAGLVLVHPFLSMLFSNLHLLNEDGAFKDISAAVHAVHILNYISGNKKENQSHMLVVEKLLCGLPPTFPILQYKEISQEEKDEICEMLGAVCQNWKSLSSTSIEGLQQSFLCRFGTVDFNDDYWTIHVESSAIDILMDDLPWGISTIVLPWCEDVIWVDWQTDY